MTRWTAALALAACTTQADVDTLSLTLDGPTSVRVDRLGVVSAPLPSLSDGTAPGDVRVTVQDQAVAQVVDGEVQATGPGKTDVTVRWRDQEAHWTLTVQPAIRLRFANVPGQLSAGEQAELSLDATIGESAVALQSVEWVSSDPTVLVVTEGVASAIAPGVAYVTAKSNGSQAMAEITVR